MKKLYLICFILFTINHLFSQSDNPCGATALTVGSSCATVVASNAGFSNTTGVPAPSCGGYTNKDGWFTFIAPASGTVVIETAAGTMTDADIAVYQGACASLTEIACDDFSGPGLMPKLNLSGLTSGDTYYIRFWKYLGGTGNFEICVWEDTPVAAYTNQDCSGATQICTTGTFDDNSNGDGTVNDLNASNRGCLADNEHQSAWYFWQIATSGTLTFTINPDAADDFDFGVWGPGFTCPPDEDPIRCSFSSSSGNTGLSSTAVDLSEGVSGDKWVKQLSVVAGEQYLLLVDNYSSTNNGFTFSFGGTATIDCSVIVLPVVLTSFTGDATAFSHSLNWTTSTEIQSDHFSIESSSDGIQFTEIGKVNASINSTEEKFYSFLNENPLQGANYYRLKLVDQTNKINYSQVILIESKNSVSLEVFPNPSDGILFLNYQVPANISNCELQVFSSYGQPVFNKKITSGNSQTEKIILPSKGLYWVVLIYDGKKIIEKITY